MYPEPKKERSKEKKTLTYSSTGTYPNSTTWTQTYTTQPHTNSGAGSTISQLGWQNFERGRTRSNSGRKGDWSYYAGSVPPSRQTGDGLPGTSHGIVPEVR